MRYPESRLAPWLVAAAVLVNGAAYWWFSSQRDLRLAEPVRVTELAPPAPTLTLLHEREVLDATKRPVAAVEAALADASEALAMGPPPPDLPADTTPARTGAPQDAPMGPPVPAPEARAAPEVAAQTPPGPTPSLCMLVGPGASAADVKRWVAAFAGTGVTLSGVQAIDQETVTGYRVMLPAPSRAEATLAKLAAAGFEGFVTDKHGSDTQISLGLFEIRANAGRLRARLLEHGYSATILVDREVRKTYWLRVRGSTKSLRGAKAALVAKFPDASRVWRDCPAQAGGPD
ncbi:MAG: SPOR domain-containing protein [Gammaproteobacteria bacterium]